MAQLDELLVYLKQNGGSDLHLAAGLEPRIRAKGRIQAIEGRPPLADGELRGLLEELASEKAWREFDETDDVDFAYGLEGVARFRANYFVQNNGAGRGLSHHPRGHHLARGSEPAAGDRNARAPRVGPRPGDGPHRLR